MKKVLSSLICLFMIIAGCKKDDDIYSQGAKGATSIDQVITFTNISATSVPADTQTTSVISVQITPDAAVANRTVSLSTNLGLFHNGTVSDNLIVDAYGKGQFEIHSAVSGMATISATLKNAKITTVLTFVAAFPDDMLISSDKYVMDTTQSATITVALSRDPGKGIVSDPAKVYFSVTGTGASQLQIPSFSYSSSGSATALLSNPTGIKGAFVITALTVNQTGSMITKTTNIQIK